MAKRILQVNFKLPQGMDLSGDEAQKGLVEGAKWIAGLPGVAWKVWIFNEEAGETGGIYLFDDESSLQQYLEGPVIAQVKSQYSDVSIKQFGVMEEPTEITRGPVK